MVLENRLYFLHLLRLNITKQRNTGMKISNTVFKLSISVSVSQNLNVQEALQMQRDHTMRFVTYNDTTDLQTHSRWVM